MVKTVFTLQIGVAEVLDLAMHPRASAVSARRDFLGKKDDGAPQVSVSQEAAPK